MGPRRYKEYCANFRSVAACDVEVSRLRELQASVVQQGRSATCIEAAIRRVLLRREYVEIVEQVAKKQGNTLDATLDNWLIRGFEDEDWEAAQSYHELTRAIGRDLFNSNWKAECRAMRDRMHPLDPKHDELRKRMFGGSTEAELRAWNDGSHPLRPPPSATERTKARFRASLRHRGPRRQRLSSQLTTAPFSSVTRRL